MLDPRSRSSKHRTHAFTLVELMAVAAIIAVLAALLLPVIGRMQTQAKKAKCLGNLHTIGTAFFAYANDHDQLAPEDGTYKGNTSPSLWRYNDKDYVNLGPLFDYAGVPRKLGGRQYTPQLFLCPGDSYTLDYWSTCSYWLNWDITARPDRKKPLFTLPPRTLAIFDRGEWWGKSPARNMNQNHDAVGFNALLLNGSVTWIPRTKTSDLPLWDWSKLVNLD
ncbi:MAG: prepilin-type N-terminal cleavage/methylation domain-containing protein [Terrimicrobiaceae bacterium]